MNDSPEQEVAISVDSVAEIALDVWRLKQRAEREEASEKVIAAIDRTEDRIRRLGFEIDTMTEQPFSENLRLRVVEHVDTEGPKRISQCLTPAVYFEGKLIRLAEVVTQGRD